jgi:hypothetical protein
VRERAAAKAANQAGNVFQISTAQKITDESTHDGGHDLVGRTADFEAAFHRIAEGEKTNQHATLHGAGQISSNNILILFKNDVDAIASENQGEDDHPPPPPPAEENVQTVQTRFRRVVSIDSPQVSN